MAFTTNGDAAYALGYRDQRGRLWYCATSAGTIERAYEKNLSGRSRDRYGSARLDQVRPGFRQPRNHPPFEAILKQISLVNFTFPQSADAAMRRVSVMRQAKLNN